MDSTTATKRARQPRLPIETRREQVLDAALRLIIRHGYAGVSMEAIAREADLAKPVVYNAFPRLGPLLEALLNREEHRAIEDLARAWTTATLRRAAETDAAGIADSARPDDPRELLVGWMRGMVAAIAARPDTWRLTLIQPEETPALVRDRVVAGRRLVVEQLRSLLDQGAAAARSADAPSPSGARARPRRLDPASSGSAATTMDTELVAEAILAVAEHCARLLLRDPDSYPPERLVAFAEQTTGWLFLSTSGSATPP